jgi:hypothetical protein
MCMYHVLVYTFVHDFSTCDRIRIVYERVRYVYAIIHSVHDRTRFFEIAQANAGTRGLNLKCFLEELTRPEKA